VSRTRVPVAGPDTLSPLNAVRLLEEESGRSFHVVHAPVSLARGMGLLLRPFDSVLSSNLGIAAHLAEAGDVLATDPFAWELLRKPVTVREHVRSAARAALTERVRVLLNGVGGRF